MSSKRNPPQLLMLLWTLLALVALAPTAPARATGAQPLPASSALAQHDGVLRLADGALALSADAAPAPALLGPFARYGLAVAEPVALAPTSRVGISYAVVTPRDAAVRVDLRGSADGQSWLPWSIDLPSGAVVGFAGPIRFAQYRVTLLANGPQSPLLRQISLAASLAAATDQAPAAEPYAVAPTFRIRATRQGMIGGRTANGYVIPPRARFVSLPSWSVLSSRGGDEYKVRISYRGRTSVVPVYDVGPYSGRDDYWDIKRDGYPDLQRGWPMDHAAYYEGYNNGWADKGYVRFPTAMDVGDGAWWDDLGIVGDQTEVEVTFLWLGQDPLAGPPARDPNQNEYIVDELGGDFWHSPALLGVSPVGCGEGRHAYRSAGVADPAQSAHTARWQPNLPVDGMYDLYIHVPICPSKRPPTTQARYVIQHRDGAMELLVNQSTQTSWVYLGRFPFVAGSGGFVQLSDVVGEPGATVWFDHVKWVRAP